MVARVEAFGSLTPEQALARATPFISGNDQRVRYLSAIYLTTPALLRRIGAAHDLAEIPLTLSLRSGSQQSVVLTPIAAPDPSDRHESFDQGYSVLIPDDIDLAGRWPHVLDEAKHRPPIYTEPTDVSSLWMGENGRVLYIRSNHIRSIDQTMLGKKLGDIIQTSVLGKRPRFVIVNLRLNNGGDLFNTILFSRALPRLLPQDGRVFVLVSRCTFSAALVTAAMMKRSSLVK